VNKPSALGATPLHCAVAQASNHQVVKLLIAARADPESQIAEDYPVEEWRLARPFDIAMTHMRSSAGLLMSRGREDTCITVVSL